MAKIFQSLKYQCTLNHAFENGLPTKVSKGAKIRNRYNQVPHLTQDTNGKVTNSQLDTTKESQKVIPFPAGDHKAHINRRAQRHSKHKTEKTLKIHKRSTAFTPKKTLPISHPARQYYIISIVCCSYVRLVKKDVNRDITSHSNIMYQFDM